MLLERVGSTRWEAQVESVKSATKSHAIFFYEVQNQNAHLRKGSSHAWRPPPVCWAAPRTLSSHHGSNFGPPVNHIAPPASPPSSCRDHHRQNQQHQHQPRRTRRRRRRAVRPLPPCPFPSPIHGSPYVLCQYCSLLLLLPSNLSFSPSAPIVTLKCGSCLNTSTFSTRHLFAASSKPIIAPAPGPLSPPAADATSMPGYEASCRGTEEALDAEMILSRIPELALQFNSLMVLQGNGGHVKGRQNSQHLAVDKLQYIAPTEAVEAPTETHASRGDSSQLKGHVEAHAPPNGDQTHFSQCKDFETRDSCHEIIEEPLEEVIMETRDCHGASQSHHMDFENLDNIACGLTASFDELQRGLPSESWNKEITVMNSVQHWVDSLTPEVDYESDSSLRCSEKCAVGCEKHVGSYRRSPLHHHFGYKSPSELFEKIVSSEDEQMKARTESNSTASSSSSSANTTCRGADVGATCMRVITPSSQGSCANNCNCRKDAQSPFTRLLKRRGLKQGEQLPGNLKVKSVVVNGHVLSSSAVKRAEERAGKLRPGSYWYDCKAGFWGVEGGPCLGILPSFIDDLSLHPMARNCSNGDTQVYVNGRELHIKDLAVLARRGLSEQACKAYALGFDGALVDETTGLEVKQLGKLAPTVERKGKGFGMFAANVIQNKATMAQGNC